MTRSNDHLESLAKITAERLLYDTQALIDQYGPDEGQRIAEKALTAMAEASLDGTSRMQPLDDREKKAVAYAVKLALATLRAETTTRN